MKIIYKYVLPDNFVVDRATDCMVEFPHNGKIVHVEVTEQTRVVIWVEFEVPNDWDGRTPQLQKNFFRRIGTGHLIPDRYNHLTTFFTSDGTYVWHLYVFEDRPDAAG